MKKIIISSIIAALFLSQAAVAQQTTGGKDNNEMSAGKGDLISMDFKGIDIVEAIKTLAARAGVNVVIGKNVSGKVTLFLKDVKVWDAFEIVLLANDLAYERKGNIVSIMPQRDYELRHGERYMENKEMASINFKYAKASELAKIANQVKSSFGQIIVNESGNSMVVIDTRPKIENIRKILQKADVPTATRVIDVKYAEAETIADVLEEELTEGIGVIRTDDRTNKLIITDSAEKIDRLIELVTAFDEKPRQVLIDAQVIEIRPSDKFEMGVDWDYWIKKNIRIISSLPTSNAPNAINIGAAAWDGDVSGVGDYKGIIDILRTIGETKILSSPRITVLNNQEAKILVGTKDAYITSSVSQSGTGTAVTSQSVNFVDVGIKLFVTPVINKDDFITMKIKPEISSSERRSILSNDQATEIPIVTTSEAETSVTIKNGVTVIIGGLRKDERVKLVKKIPLLGDIPFLGFFFRNTFDEVKNTELVILLTPHLMSGETPYTEFSTKAPEQGSVVRMRSGKIVVEDFPSEEPDQVDKSQ
jgi:type II secretory pathway component GspD/PulD (secretin)